MMLGRMREKIVLAFPTPALHAHETVTENIEKTGETFTDSDGFAHIGYTPLWAGRAIFEPQHASRAWANRAAFSKATALFTVRLPPAIRAKCGQQDSISLTLFAKNTQWVVDSVQQYGTYTVIAAHNRVGMIPTPVVANMFDQ